MRAGSRASKTLESLHRFPAILTLLWVFWPCRPSAGHAASQGVAPQGPIQKNLLLDLSRREEIAWLRRAAQEGEVDAQFDLACAYADGNGVPHNPRTAYRWFVKAAAQGDHEAMTAVGYCLLNGEGVDADHKAAVDWFRKSMALGDRDAPLYMASCLLYGEGVPKDVTAGLEMAREIWESSEDPQYAYLIARAHEDLLDDDVNARRWHRLAADKGDDEAMLSLGDMHRFGLGGARSLKTAFGWYQASADAGNLEGLATLAYCYAVGEGVRADESKAFELYKQAADQGDEESRLSVAACYLHGSGVERDAERGLALLKEMAVESPMAAMRLAEALYDGELVPQDLEGTVHWLKEAASHDVPEAITFLGVLHWNGEGLLLDKQAAREHYQRAVGMEEPHALFNLGLAGGMEGPDDIAEEDVGPIEWELIEKAAALGHGRAAVMLATRWIDGVDLPPDPKRGFEYLAPALEVEDPDALCFAAECYRDGVGVEVDLQRAMECFDLAQTLGLDTRVERGLLRRQIRNLDGQDES